jgi:hypothetical protein
MADPDFTPEEEFRKIPGWEETYSVSNLGRVRRDKSLTNTFAGRILRPCICNHYLRVTLSQNGKRKDFHVHTLVAAAFVGPRPVGREVNHRDTNKTNNRADNLEYLTHLEHQQHSIANNLKARGSRHGRHTKPECTARGDRSGSRLHPERVARGERQHLAKLRGDDVRSIRTSSKSTEKIAAQYGVAPTTVRDIRRGRTWKHID